MGQVLSGDHPPQGIIAEKKAAALVRPRKTGWMDSSAQLAEAFEDAEEEKPVDNNGDNVQCRVVGKQQERGIAGVEQKTDEKRGLASSAGKKSQRNKNADGNSIDRQHRAHLAFGADSGDRQPDGHHKWRAGKKQHGVDRGEAGDNKED